MNLKKLAKLLSIICLIIITATNLPAQISGPSTSYGGETDYYTDFQTIPNCQNDGIYFAWSIDGGGTISTSVSVHITWPNQCATHTVKCVISSPGCQTITNTKQVSVTCFTGNLAFTQTHSTISYCNKTPLTFSVAGVTGATSYTWVYPTGWTVSGSSTGTTIILVPDGVHDGTISCVASNGSLSSTATTTVTISNPLVASATVTHTGTTGTVNITASGGNTPYTYQLLNIVTGFNQGPQLSYSFTSVPSSTYSYIGIVTDHTGCNLTPSLIINIVPQN